MKFLAFDTSGEYLSVALQQGEQRLVRAELARQQHSSWLLPWIDDMLQQAGLRLADLDAIVFGNGPGAFTGLRIGAGVAQGLALGSGRPLVPVCSLLALAQQGASVGLDRVVACVDARLDQVYLAAYEWVEGDWLARVPPGMFDAHAVPPLPGTGWCVAGSGLQAHPALVEQWGGAVARCEPDWFAHAEHLLAPAQRQLAAGGAVDAAAAELLYLRDKVAQTLAERARPA